MRVVSMVDRAMRMPVAMVMAVLVLVLMLVAVLVLQDVRALGRGSLHQPQ